jgi:excisionase family DNA binding protein
VASIGSRRYLTPGEVARALGVSPRTIDRWADLGRIPCIVTLGGHRRFTADAVETLALRMGIRAAPGPIGVGGGPEVDATRAVADSPPSA